MEKLIISDYITSKTRDIFEESECINSYGFNEREELCVITEDMEEVKKIATEIEETINAYHFDEAVKCDCCHHIVMIEYSTIVKGENICNDCNFEDEYEDDEENIDDPEYFNEKDELDFIDSLDD